jgi:hypothetical protein
MLQRLLRLQPYPLGLLLQFRSQVTLVAVNISTAQATMSNRDPKQIAVARKRSQLTNSAICTLARQTRLRVNRPMALRTSASCQSAIALASPYSRPSYAQFSQMSWFVPDRMGQGGSLRNIAKFTLGPSLVQQFKQTLLLIHRIGMNTDLSQRSRGR